MRRATRALVLFACAASAACAAILDLEPPPEGGAPDAADASIDGDASSPFTCALQDAAVPGDDANTIFRAFTQQDIDDSGTTVPEGGMTAIDFFNVSGLKGAPAVFEGAAFDGAHVYLVPATPTGSIVQYDLSKSFTSTGSWAVFDPSTTLNVSVGFSGAVFDGQYVYFVPHGASTLSGVVLRYDKTQAFASAAAWSTFDLQTLPNDGGAPARGFSGGAFDGRFVYFVPEQTDVSTFDGRMLRYDTTGDGGVVDAGDAGDAAPPPPFQNPARWSSFDTSTVNGSATGFRGAIYDGHWVTLVPFENDVVPTSPNSGIITRYDTKLPFGTGSSWLTYDIAQKNANAVGFTGAAFDGRYIYLAPHASSTVVRFDTQGTLGASASYTMFDVAPIFHTDAGPPSFAGAAFDGRYVYFAPSGPGVGVVVRYDTLSTFTATCAWSTLDFTKYNAQSGDFFGAVYDGRYLYLVPHGSWVARFDTKFPAWMPPVPGNGSFY